MTEEEARELGLFTGWEVYPCQQCDKFALFHGLHQFGAVIVCTSCLEKLKKSASERSEHPNLFDGLLF